MHSHSRLTQLTDYLTGKTNELLSRIKKITG